MRKLFIIGIFIMGLVVESNHTVNADEIKQNEIQLVKQAFDAQVKLSEKERNMNEITAILNPYFTKSFISKFLQENLVKTDHGYLTFGTDYALYYIPFFSYTDKTKVVFENDKLYVFEKIDHSGEGPVDFTQEYQGVKLIKDQKKWKINEVTRDIPQPIIDQSIKKVGTVENGRDTEITIEVMKKNNSFSVLNSLIPFSTIQSPFTMFYHGYYPMM